MAASVRGVEVDTEWARQELREFLQIVDDLETRQGSFEVSPQMSRDFDYRLTRRAHVVEAILDRVLPRWRETVPKAALSPWKQYRNACLRATEELERGEELRAKLGDNSPTLDAGRLHPWVWEGARSLWQSGHYREAVTAAARQLNAETQNRCGSRALSEKDLFIQAFSDDAPKADRPRLRLPGDDDSPSAASARRGIRAYAEGCFAALRNPAAHDVLDKLPEHEALEQLAAFSVLARWVDRARLITAPPEATS